MKKSLILAAVAAIIGISSAFAQEIYTREGSTYNSSRTRIADGIPSDEITFSSLIPRSHIGMEVSPIALSLCTPAQFPPQDWDINGLRINLLWGIHNNVSVLDLGVLANICTGDMYGIQIAGISNDVACSCQGLQIATLLNRSGGNIEAIQVACFNINGPDSYTNAIQLGLMNMAGNASGIQAGIFNKAADMQGLQIGLINCAYSLDGVQIGLCNFIENAVYPFMIGINIGL